MKILLAAALLAPFASFAGTICKQLPAIPNSTYVQPFEINNGNQVAAGTDADSGGAVYSAGRWTLTQVPGGGGPLGINDAGDLAGVSGSPETGFIYSGGSFQFFNAPGWQNTESRAISNSGIVTGQAWDADEEGNQVDGVGFIYNPGGAAHWPAGLSTFRPTLPDGTESWSTIAAQMNDAGQIAGGSFFFVPRGQYGWLYDPSGGLALFQINGWRTRARGINNRGDILAEAIDPDTGNWRNFIKNGASVTEVSCPNIDASANGGIFMIGINDARVISAEVGDLSGPAIMVFPDAATALADLIECSDGIGPGKSLPAKARSAAASLASGDVAGTCTALAGYASEVTAQAGKKVDALAAPSLLSEVSAIRADLGCH